MLSFAGSEDRITVRHFDFAQAGERTQLGIRLVDPEVTAPQDPVEIYEAPALLQGTNQNRVELFLGSDRDEVVIGDYDAIGQRIDAEGGGRDIVRGGGGTDDLVAGGNDDWVEGGEGADIVGGQGGDDVLFGGGDSAVQNIPNDANTPEASLLILINNDIEWRLAA